MEKSDRHLHWENIYRNKKFTESGWYQAVPHTSLQFLKLAHLKPDAKIIDIGGGESFLADHLLDLGFHDITVLDISETAIHRAQDRLGVRASKVKWIIEDVTLFTPVEHYDFWHDRAAFHFLIRDEDIEKYMQVLRTGLNPGGYFVIGTFSERGPKKCSGIDIRQYSEWSMTNLLSRDFEKIKCVNVDHKTPTEVIQNYTFCSFRKKMVA